jgi:MATE family multidrug resistance protein
MFVLNHPDPFIAIGGVSPAIEEKAKLYLTILSFSTPANMIMRTYMALHNAISKPKMITRFASNWSRVKKYLLNYLFIYLEV